MKIIGVTLVNPASPTNKFYTIVLADKRIITNYGQGNSADAAKPSLVPVNGTKKGNDHPDAATALRKFQQVYNSKKKEYTLVVNPMATASTTTPLTSDADILRVFYSDRTFKTAASQSGPIQQFMNGARTTPRPQLNMDGTVNDSASAPAAPTPIATPAPAPVTPPTGLHVTGKVTRPNGEVYYPRWVGEHHDVALLRNLYQHNLYARVYGPPGAGKTAVVEAAFPDCLTINGHGDMTVAHFVGSLLPTPSGGWTWGDGPLTRAMREGKILFVDEITRVPTEVLSVLYSTLDGRNILRIDDRPDLEPIHAAKGFGVIAGYNPDTLGARALDEALISRFRIGIEVTTDYNAAKHLKVPKEAINVAKNLNSRDQDDRDNGGPGIWVPQMRELLTYRDLIKAGVGDKFAAMALLGACPNEDDVETVAEVMSNVFGFPVTVPSLANSI